MLKQGEALRNPREPNLIAQGSRMKTSTNFRDSYKTVENLKRWPAGSDVIISSMLQGRSYADIAADFQVTPAAISRKMSWVKRQFGILDSRLRLEDHPTVSVAAAYWGWLLQHPAGERVVLYYWMRCGFSTSLTAQKYFYCTGTVAAMVRNAYRRRGITRNELRRQLEAWRKERAVQK